MNTATQLLERCVLSIDLAIQDKKLRLIHKPEWDDIDACKNEIFMDTLLLKEIEEKLKELK